MGRVRNFDLLRGGYRKGVHLHPCVAILLRHAPGHRGRIMLSFYLWISFRFGPWAASWDNFEELGHLGGQLLSAIRGRCLGCSCYSSPASWEYVACDGAESSTHLEIRGLVIVVGAEAQRPRLWWCQSRTGPELGTAKVWQCQSRTGPEMGTACRQKEKTSVWAQYSRSTLL